MIAVDFNRYTTLFLVHAGDKYSVGREFKTQVYILQRYGYSFAGILDRWKNTNVKQFFIKNFLPILKSYRFRTCRPWLQTLEVINTLVVLDRNFFSLLPNVDRVQIVKCSWRLNGFKPNNLNLKKYMYVYV